MVPGFRGRLTNGFGSGYIQFVIPWDIQSIRRRDKPSRPVAHPSDGLGRGLPTVFLRAAAPWRDLYNSHEEESEAVF